MDNNIVEKIAQIITDKILASSSNQPIKADTALLSSGLKLDSITVLELIAEIETEFGVEFQDTDISVDLFQSVGTLAGIVEHKIAGGAGG